MAEEMMTTYEERLMPADLLRLHALLFKPGISLEEVRSKIPLWKSGPGKGKPPSLRCLDEICKRLTKEGSISHIRGIATMMAEVKEECGGDPDLGRLSGPVLDMICSLLGQQILGRVSQRKGLREDNEKLRIILKRQDQRLARAEFMRETCKQFVNWFKNEKARQIAQSRDSNAEKIEKLGKLIFKEHW